MEIIKPNYNFTHSLDKRSKTDYIVVHHSGSANSAAQQINEWHKNNGWSGIGYHFVVQKDGTIYEGRPLNTLGAHCIGFNSNSIGVCFEGNFNSEKPTDKQIYSGRELLSYLQGKYSTAKIVGHRDLYSTECPGKNFDLSVLEEKETEEMVTYYDWTTACPEWSIPYVQKALDLGIIKGDEQGRLRLTDDKIWCLVITLRATGHMK